MTLPIKPRLGAVLAAVALAGLSAAPAALAAPHSQMDHGKKRAAHAVYVCKDCKAYYSAMQAKKMGYKDGMGHTLVKQAGVPAGYMDGSKMKM